DRRESRLNSRSYPLNTTSAERKVLDTGLCGERRKTYWAPLTSVTADLRCEQRKWMLSQRRGLQPQRTWRYRHRSGRPHQSDLPTRTFWFAKRSLARAGERRLRGIYHP